jgi:hypothetical protein
MIDPRVEICLHNKCLPEHKVALKIISNTKVSWLFQLLAILDESNSFSLINYSCHFLKLFYNGKPQRKTWTENQGSMLWSHFLPIFGEKLAFFSKTNVVIKILHNLALIWVKNAHFFAEKIGENLKKIITSVPDQDIQVQLFLSPNDSLN